MVVRNTPHTHAHGESEDTCWFMLVILLAVALYAGFLLLDKCGYFN